MTHTSKFVSKTVITAALSVISFGCSTTKTNPVAQNAAGIEGARSPANYVIQTYNILDRLESSGAVLSEETKDWMKKWRGIDLDDTSKFAFKELSGSTSINLKVEKIDPTDPKGYKSRGSFVPRNGAGNPNTEIAYFNMAAILGWDRIFRPAARYELGPVASSAFKSLINKASIHGGDRTENRDHILKAISSGQPLKGCLKAKKDKTTTDLDAMVSPSTPPNGAPKSSHPVIAALQASNSMPQKGAKLTLRNGYVGDAYELAHEYSIIMTLDVVFGQWDRYSGGNVTIRKDEAGNAHFYATDNGGADIGSKTSWNERNNALFSRYDRDAIAKLKQINEFLKNPSQGFMGYTSAEEFVTDLGLYFEIDPTVYAQRLQRNLQILLTRVAATEASHGDKAYF